MQQPLNTTFTHEGTDCYAIYRSVVPVCQFSSLLAQASVQCTLTKHLYPNANMMMLWQFRTWLILLPHPYPSHRAKRRPFMRRPPPPSTFAILCLLSGTTACPFGQTERMPLKANQREDAQSRIGTTKRISHPQKLAVLRFNTRRACERRDS